MSTDNEYVASTDAAEQEVSSADVDPVSVESWSQEVQLGLLYVATFVKPVPGFSAEWFGDLQGTQGRSPMVRYATLLERHYKEATAPPGIAIDELIRVQNHKMSEREFKLLTSLWEAVKRQQVTDPDALIRATMKTVQRHIVGKFILGMAGAVEDGRQDWLQVSDGLWSQAQKAARDVGGNKRRIELAKAGTLTAPPVDWLVEGIIPAGMLTMVSGAPGVGKTLSLMDLFAAVLGAGSEKFMGHFATRRGGVVALLLDDPLPLIIDRQQKLGIHNAELDYWSPKQREDDPSELAVDLTDPVKMIHDLADICMELQPKLIAIDALYLLLPEAIEAPNSVTGMRPLMNALNDLAKKTGAAVVVIHHNTKDGKTLAGSYAIGAACKVAMQFLNDGDELGDKILDVFKNKMAIPVRLKFSLRFNEDGTWAWEYQGDERQMRRAEDNEVILASLAEQADGMTVSELCKAVPSLKPDTVKSRLKQLIAEEKVVKGKPVSGPSGGRPTPRYTLVAKATDKVKQFFRNKPAPPADEVPPDWVTEEAPAEAAGEAF